MDENELVNSDKSVKDLEEIDNLIHEPVRLGILVLLLPRPSGLAFNTVQNILGLSPGNLSSHAQKLFQANYIMIIKMFVNFKPKTFFKITPEGEEAIKKYANNLGNIIFSILGKNG
ncbi:MAG: transcriptional regulator [Candidatus Hodarchaeales archaeon]|jgi:DNA-binding MarR family transcriptional regulator